MELLHRHQIDSIYLDSLNITVDENGKPQIVGFNSEFVNENEEDFPYLTPPEIKSNPKNYDIYKANVYSLGAFLYYSTSLMKMKKIVISTVGEKTLEIELMNKCINPDPDKRPTFLEICEAIESKGSLNSELTDYINSLKGIIRFK